MTAVDTRPVTPETRRRSPQRTSALARFLRRPLGTISLVFLILLLISSFAPGLLSPIDPQAADLANVLSGPSGAHILGTDALGRDMYARVVYGAGAALFGVLLTVLVAAVIAIPIGLACSLSRRTDAVISGVNDVVLSIPGIIVILMVLAMTGSLNWAMAGLGLLVAPGLIRVVRSAAIAVVEEPYISAARVFGVGRAKIAVRHVLPRVAGPVLVNVSLIAASALVTEAGINFLGLGLEPPAPTWGGLVADGAAAINQSAWALVPGGGVIAVTVTAFVLLGDAIRDVTTESWASGRAKGLRAVVGGLVPVQALPPDHEATLPVDADAVLSVRDLSIAFPNPSGGETVVVQSVSFDIRRGEAVGVVGESGCGKTITGLGVLGMLPAAARVVAGTIVLDGAEITDLSPQRRQALRGTQIAFVSQEPMTALDPLFTIGSQISEAVRTHTGASRGRARARVLELLEQVQIVDPARVAKSYPHEISGGMAQRVAIAIALAGSPKLLIADEPTTALDVTVQAEIIALLGELRRQTGMAVMLISHDWGVVSEACTRAVVMYAGQVVERASIENVLADPLHPYTAGLLAANPHFARPGERLITIRGAVPAPAAWPTSCHFAGRCPLADTACGMAPVPLVLTAPERLSRCIHVDELRASRAGAERTADV